MVRAILKTLTTLRDRCAMLAVEQNRAVLERLADPSPCPSPPLRGRGFETAKGGAGGPVPLLLHRVGATGKAWNGLRAILEVLRVSGLQGLVPPDSPTAASGVVEVDGRYRLAADPATVLTSAPSTTRTFRIPPASGTSS